MLVMGAWMGFAGQAAIAQGGAAPATTPAAAAATTPTRRLAFEVVSIRPSKPDSNEAFTTDILPDGYRVRGQSLYHTIMVAYSSQFWMYWSEGRFMGAPGWVMSDLYDIDAKVAPEDLAEWQKQGNNSPAQRTVFHAMLQAALEDRCKLVLHRVPAEAPGYALVVGKHGSKLKETKSEGSAAPAEMALPDGGTMVFSSDRSRESFVNASMSSFALALMLTSSGPTGVPTIYDETGLTGRYDFVLRRRDASPPAAAPESGPAADPMPAIPWDLEELGLELKRAKVPTEALVIDHIERPSEN